MRSRELVELSNTYTPAPLPGVIGAMGAPLGGAGGGVTSTGGGVSGDIGDREVPKCASNDICPSLLIPLIGVIVEEK